MSLFPRKEEKAPEQDSPANDQPQAARLDPLVFVGANMLLSAIHEHIPEDLRDTPLRIVIPAFVETLLPRSARRFPEQDFHDLVQKGRAEWKRESLHLEGDEAS